jgi:hypothetical protein
MTTRSQESSSKSPGYVTGQRLYCQTCRLEIEIISPSTRIPSPPALRCCNRDMTPMVGASIHLEE